MQQFISNKKIVHLIFSTFLLSGLLIHPGYWNEVNLNNLAVVIVPIADATAKSIINSKKGLGVIKNYDKFPISRGAKIDSCPRAHQFLFNEVVKVKREKDGECECEVSNIFYDESNIFRINNKKHKFWTLKENLVLLKDLKQNDIDLNIFPCPYCDNLENILPLKGHIVLIEPWFDFITQRNYSIGTKFVRKPDLDCETEYAITILAQDYSKKITYVPKDQAVSKYQPTYEKAIKQFVKILKGWANIESIAYVWGGCSCSKLYREDDFRFEVLENGTGYWIRPEIECPFSGFDGSGLVLRAAQICGLPYFFKNPNTLVKYLRPLKKNEYYDNDELKRKNELLENGDLIFFDNHVMVVSTVQNNEIIEARGYSVGFGKIHRIKLNQLFENINSFNELIDAYSKGYPLGLLDKKKRITKLIFDFKLLKMSSLAKDILWGLDTTNCLEQLTGIQGRRAKI